MIGVDLSHMVNHAKAEYPREACGLVVLMDGKKNYIPCRNIAENSRDFILDPQDYARAEDLGTVTALFHSHPNAPATPSQADRVSCESSGLPWVILSLPSETWATIEPSGYVAPLIGREFSYGVLDCYRLIQDWYLENRGVKLPFFDHREGWWSRGEDVYMENFRKAGFEPTTEPLEIGDVILMQIRSKVANHGAVYIGRDMILHHLTNQLSRRDVYSGYWRKNTRLVVRFRGEK